MEEEEPVNIVYITHGWRIPRGLNRRGPEMGFVRPFLLSAIVLARRQGSEPFVGRARESENEEGEEQCEKFKCP